MEWPVFKWALAILRRFPFIDSQSVESYTYLGGICNKAQSRLAHLMEVHNREFVVSVNISSERWKIRNLVDRHFRRVYIKNRILDRRTVRKYSEMYYESGPLFNLETCLVLIVCALGAVIDDIGPYKLTGGYRETPHDQSARFEAMRLANCHSSAAEQRCGAAIMTSSVLAIQYLCLSGYVSIPWRMMT